MRVDHHVRVGRQVELHVAGHRVDLRGVRARRAGRRRDVSAHRGSASTGQEWSAPLRSPLGPVVAVTAAAAPEMSTSPADPDRHVDLDALGELHHELHRDVVVLAGRSCGCSTVAAALHSPPVDLGQTAQIIVPEDVGTACTVTLFGSDDNQLRSVSTTVSVPDAAVTSMGPVQMSRMASVWPGFSFECQDQVSPWVRPGASKSPPKLALKSCASAGIRLPVRLPVLVLEVGHAFVPGRDEGQSAPDHDHENDGSAEDFRPPFHPEALHCHNRLLLRETPAGFVN